MECAVPEFRRKREIVMVTAHGGCSWERSLWEPHHQQNLKHLELFYFFKITSQLCQKTSRGKRNKENTTVFFTSSQINICPFHLETTRRRKTLEESIPPKILHFRSNTLSTEGVKTG